MSRAAIFALASASVACGGSHCERAEAAQPAPMQRIVLEDGGALWVPAPIAIYGTSPPPHCPR